MKAQSSPHIVAQLNDHNVTLQDPRLKQDMTKAKAEFLQAVGGPGEHVMRKLGLKQLSGSNDAYSISDANNPLRLFWYSHINVIMVKSTQPCNGNDVSAVVKELAARIQQILPQVLPRIGFHINSGTHGDELGCHALPGSREEGYVEPVFLQEDLKMAVYDAPVKVTIADLATMTRKCPKSCLLVIDAFCYSGRGHHHHRPCGDPRTGENVELIMYPDAAPYLQSDTWEEESIVDCFPRMTLEEAKELLRSDPKMAAFCHVGGSHSGLRIQKGPLQGKLLAYGATVFFADGFHYWFGGTERNQRCITVTKEPRMMKGA